MLPDLQEVESRCEALIGALFPRRHESPPALALARPIPPVESKAFLAQLEEWWDDANERTRVLREYEEDVWPAWLRRDGLAKGLIADSTDHWLGLLVLGACQSVGRQTDAQHRSFLEKVHNAGWWDVFKSPNPSGPWMGVLDDWQDQSNSNLDYARWMELFPAIYQLSRHLATYRRLLRGASGRALTPEIKRLLAPRTNPDFTGAGRAFDVSPAPLDMGVHWVLRGTRTPRLD